MTITLKVWMPDQLFYANPWGHIRAEEKVEPMPSPWRMLRALICRAHQAQVNEAELHELIDLLSSELPIYSIPRFEKVVLHHPVKLNEIDRSTGLLKQRILVNAGVAFNPATPIVITWLNVNLPKKPLALLTDLCDRITYLGRRNSSVEIAVTTDAMASDLYNGVPCENQSTHRLLAPVSAHQYSLWLKQVKELGVSEKLVPASVLACLSLTTEEIEKLGYTNPPGSQWVSYRLEQQQQPRQYAMPTLKKPVKVVRVSLSTPVLPPITYSLPVAEALRSVLAKITGDHHLVVGKDAAGDCTKEPHLKYLPEGEPIKGVIPSVLLFQEDGIPFELLQQIQKLNKQRLYYCNPKRQYVELIVSHSGQSPQFKSPLIGSSTVWHSLTPFLMRFVPKRRQNRIVKYSLPEQVIKLLAYQGIPAPIEINEIPVGTEVGRFVWGEYKTLRAKRESSRGVPKKPYGLELIFAEPVSGPISIGYAAYFGNGLFRPVSQQLEIHQVRPVMEEEEILQEA